MGLHKAESHAKMTEKAAPSSSPRWVAWGSRQSLTHIVGPTGLPVLDAGAVDGPLKL